MQKTFTPFFEVLPKQHLHKIKKSIFRLEIYSTSSTINYLSSVKVPDQSLECFWRYSCSKDPFYDDQFSERFRKSQ
jgi:hypothetical protein